MASKNITKPEFSEGLALGPILFWIAAIVAIPFLFIWGALQAIFDSSDDTLSPHYSSGEDDLQKQAREQNELIIAGQILMEDPDKIFQDGRDPDISIL